MKNKATYIVSWTSLNNVWSCGSGDFKSTVLEGVVGTGWPWVHSWTTLASVSLTWADSLCGHKEMRGPWHMLVPFLLLLAPSNMLLLLSWDHTPCPLSSASSPPLFPSHHQKPSDVVFWNVCKASHLTLLSSPLSVPATGHPHLCLNLGSSLSTIAPFS